MLVSATRKSDASPQGQRSAHLTYCTSIHPGETLTEVRRNLEQHVLMVKRRVSLQQPFGVGLRLSARAARELAHRDTLASFRAWLAEHGLYVFTLNGFPYGDFHGRVVKERVYAPDWQTAERRAYTDLLAELLIGLLPDDRGIEGSISTVPCGFQSSCKTPEQLAECATNILDHAAKLWRLRHHTGRHLALALEPEPFCALETVRDAVGFFERFLFTNDALLALSKRTGLSRTQAEDAARTHLGVCVDACHEAVGFQEPRAALDALARAGVRVPKLQISAGVDVHLVQDSSAVLEELAHFADDTYLHQVFERCEAGERRYLDLSAALLAARADPGRSRHWRVHFHVPVFLAQLGLLGSTQGALRELLALARERNLTQHYEVETYTWDVLPESYRALDVTEAVARELWWACAELEGSSAGAARG